MDGLLLALTIATALGCGLSAGVFFAFSSFIMPALARLRASAGTEAMQAINVAAVTPAFMTVLFAPAAGAAVLLVAGALDAREPFAPFLIGGGALYLAGPIALTIGYHVPRNDALAAVAAGSAEGDRTWTRYVREWTRGNHVRAAAALGAAAAFTLAAQAG